MEEEKPVTESRLKVGVDGDQRRWLMAQPAGAAGTIRELIDAARKGGVSPSVVRAVLATALEQIRQDHPVLLTPWAAAEELEKNTPVVMRLVERICERLLERGADPQSSIGVAQAHAAENIRLRRIIGRAVAASDNKGGSASDAVQDMLSALRDVDGLQVVVDKTRGEPGPFSARFDLLGSECPACPECGQNDIRDVVAFGHGLEPCTVEDGPMAGSVELRAAKGPRGGMVKHQSGKTCTLVDVRPLLKAHFDYLQGEPEET